MFHQKDKKLLGTNLGEVIDQCGQPDKNIEHYRTTGRRLLGVFASLRGLSILTKSIKTLSKMFILDAV